MSSTIFKDYPDTSTPIVASWLNDVNAFVYSGTLQPGLKTVLDGLYAGGSAATWGTITGVLSAQTDLNNVLGAKITNPMSAVGDLIVGGTAGAPGRLGIGADGQVLTVAGSALSWATPSAGGAGNWTYTSSTGITALSSASAGAVAEFWNSGSMDSTIPSKGSMITDILYGNNPLTWTSSGYTNIKRITRAAADYTDAPTTYTTLPQLCGDIVVLDNSAGYQSSYSTDSGGRTGIHGYYSRIQHRALGDMTGFFSTISMYNSSHIGSISGTWTGQPSGTVVAGEVWADNQKVNLYGSEFQLYSNSQPNVNAIGAVYGLYRDNNVADYNQAWVGIRVQSELTTYSDVAFQASGTITTGVDTTGLASGAGAAFVAAASQKFYLGAPASTWPVIKPTLSGPYLVSDGTYIACSTRFNGTGQLGLNSPTTAASATAGTAAPLPSAPFTYITIVMDGVSYKIPVYNA